jgi:hypothetical protein
MSRTALIGVATTLTSMLAVSIGYAGQAAPARTVLSGPFLGSYTATLTPEGAIDKGDARMAGKFTLVLRRNGTYSASNPLDGPTVRGRLAALAGHRLRFYDDFGCKTGGFERPQGGTYRWSLDGRRLTLERVSEGPCWGRTQTLTYPVWIRK